MAFIPGLSKSQVVKVIQNYADLAPATMQLITDLSAQINDPLDPAAALIGRMVEVESDVNSVVSDISSLSSAVSGKQDAVPGISSNEIGTLDGIQSSIQGQLDSKAPSSSPTLSDPTLTGTVTLPNSSISNSKLVNSSISINGTSVPLGGNATVIGTALPSQTDNAGKALVTDGSSLSWQTVDVSNLTNPTINVDSFSLIETEHFSHGETLTLIKNNYDRIVNMSLSSGSPFAQACVNETPEGFSSYKVRVPNWFLDTTINPDYVNPTYVDMQLQNAQYNAGDNSYSVSLYVALDVLADYAIQTVQMNGDVSLYLYAGATINQELIYLDGVTSNIQDQLTFDTMQITQELDNVAVMLLNSGRVNYYQANDPNTTSITVEIAEGISGGVYTYLNDAMKVGQAATFVLMIKNGATTSYPGTIIIASPISGQTNIRWQGGSAPTSGNLNAVDVYTFTVVKLGNYVFDIFADVAKFA